MNKSTLMAVAIGAVSIFLGQWLYAQYVTSRTTV